ncbi:hypothetical protein NU08_1245 [Flavobacterium anhuiense]|uniref:Uncharacterized protein n=1 Tax=Flavobacterium anhuiense TaxID=459526 RepID=A0A444W1I4_9FLAO|nr:hypothetical protein NU08_1245 [Flavobacterium anhuiense]
MVQTYHNQTSNPYGIPYLECKYHLNISQNTKNKPHDIKISRKKNI